MTGPTATADVIAGGDERTRRRRRWPWLVLAAVVLAAVAVPPARTQFDRWSLRRLQHIWAVRAAYDDARDAALEQLRQRAVPGDEPRVARATAALLREEAEQLGSLTAAAGDVRVLDRELRELRDALRSALSGERRTLLGYAERATPVTPLTFLVDPAAHRVERLLDGARKQLSIRPGTASARLHAADETLAALRRFLDIRTGVRLLVRSPAGGVQVLDLDASRAVPAPFSLPPDAFLLPRPGYLAVWSSEDGVATAVPIDGGAQTSFGGGVESLLAGPTPATVWLVRGDGAELVDGAGRRRAGPVPLPVAVPTVSAGSYLVLAAEGPGSVQGIEVFDPLAHRVVHRVSARCAVPMLGWSTGFAWRDGCGNTGGGSLHLTDLTTGADRVVIVPGRTVEEGIGDPRDVAPDGRRIAVRFFDAATARTELRIVETATARQTLVPVPHEPTGLVAWTANSRRIFFTVGRDFTAPTASLATYALGDPRAAYVRYGARGPLQPVTVLP